MPDFRPIGAVFAVCPQGRLAGRAGFARILSSGFRHFFDGQQLVLPFTAGERAGDGLPRLAAQQECRPATLGQFLLQGRAFPAHGLAAHLHIGQQIFRQYRQGCHSASHRHVELLPQGSILGAILGTAMHQRHVLNAQVVDHRLQKGQPLLLGVHQRHLQVRAGQRQGQAGKPGPRTHVDQPPLGRDQPRLLHGHQAVHIVAVDHLVLHRHSGEIHAGVPVHQQSMIVQKLLRQRRIKGDAALLQARR